MFEDDDSEEDGMFREIDLEDLEEGDLVLEECSYGDIMGVVTKALHCRPDGLLCVEARDCQDPDRTIVWGSSPGNSAYAPYLLLVKPAG